MQIFHQLNFLYIDNIHFILLYFLSISLPEKCDYFLKKFFEIFTSFKIKTNLPDQQLYLTFQQLKS